MTAEIKTADFGGTSGMTPQQIIAAHMSKTDDMEAVIVITRWKAGTLSMSMSAQSIVEAVGTLGLAQAAICK